MKLFAIILVIPFAIIELFRNLIVWLYELIKEIIEDIINDLKKAIKEKMENIWEGVKDKCVDIKDAIEIEIFSWIDAVKEFIKIKKGC